MKLEDEQPLKKLPRNESVETLNEFGSDDLNGEKNEIERKIEYTRFKSPIAKKINKEIKHMHLLCDAVETRMPQNSKHLRESLQKAQNLMKKLEEHQEFHTRDPLLMNRLLANRRKQHYKQKIWEPLKGEFEKRKIAMYAMMTTICLGFLIVLALSKDYLPYEQELGDIVTLANGGVTTYSLQNSPLNRIEVHMTIPSWEVINSSSSAINNYTDVPPDIFISLEEQGQSSTWNSIGKTEKCAFQNDATECFFAFPAKKLVSDQSENLQLAYRLEDISPQNFTVIFLPFFSFPDELFRCNLFKTTFNNMNNQFIHLSSSPK